MGDTANSGLMKAINWVSVAAGLVTIGAGVMGCVWGVKVLKPWPPLTWNNFVGGVFMMYESRPVPTRQCIRSKNLC